MASSTLQQFGEPVYAAGDVREPLRAMIDRVEAGDVREQGLRGADIGGRLLAADMLLTGLQRHAVGRIPVRIHGDADDPPGNLAHVNFAGREKRGVRAPVTQGHAEALGVSIDDVRAHFARRSE